MSADPCLDPELAASAYCRERAWLAPANRYETPAEWGARRVRALQASAAGADAPLAVTVRAGASPWPAIAIGVAFLFVLWSSSRG
jgi:hypothetical protein